MCMPSGRCPMHSPRDKFQWERVFLFYIFSSMLRCCIVTGALTSNSRNPNPIFCSLVSSGHTDSAFGNARHFRLISLIVLYPSHERSIPKAALKFNECEEQQTRSGEEFSEPSDWVFVTKAKQLPRAIGEILGGCRVHYSPLLASAASHQILSHPWTERGTDSPIRSI
jgi:hypothetical protein